MEIEQEVIAVIGEALELEEHRIAIFGLETPLLGAVPELDSMAVIGLIHLLEERFEFIAEDEEIDGTTFATVASLVEYVGAKKAAKTA